MSVEKKLFIHIFHITAEEYVLFVAWLGVVWINEVEMFLHFSFADYFNELVFIELFVDLLDVRDL